MAADLELKHVTVNQWRHRRSIPPGYWPLIITKAAARGFSLSLEQFSAAFLPQHTVATCGACERSASDPACDSCTRTDCGLRQKEAA